MQLPALIVDEIRTKKLSEILNDYSETLNNSNLKTKDQIMDAFTFQTPATIFNLYDKETERIASLVEVLEEFFFAGRVSFDFKPHNSTFSGTILLTRFRNLFHVAIYYIIRNNGKVDTFPDLLRILTGKPLQITKLSFPELINDLENILYDNEELLTDGYAIRDILKAYTAKKPVTTIELNALEPSVVKSFIKELKPFFFVQQGFSEPDLLEYVFTGDLIVSRFENLADILTHCSHTHHGVLDRFADIAGFLLLTKPPIEIAKYCRYYSKNLIK